MNPFERQLNAETRTEAGYVAVTTAEGRVEPVVVPGFPIDVAWFWREELPSAMSCLGATFRRA